MQRSGFDPASRTFVEITYDATITSVDTPMSAPENALLIAPAWIDLQVNGFAGVDYNNPAAAQEEIARSVEAIHSTGTARFYPTIVTNSPADMRESLRNLTRAKRSLPSIEAFHVEGPFICPDDGPRGAHPLRWVRPPDIEEYKRWQEAAEGNVRLVTLSPEWPEAPRFIEALTGDGVVAAIGHTKASASEIDAAVSAGATMSTHLGNGSHFQLRRHPNYIWDQLADDRLAAGIICDGIHLDPSFVKVAVRAKGVTRCVLVTDATSAAMAKPGRYRLGEMDIEATADGRAVLPGTDRLAGSALRPDAGIGNVVRMAGVSLPEALAMAARNPARVGRIAGRQRGLAPGDRADLVLFRWDEAAKRIHPVETIVDGRSVWSATA